MTKSAFTTEVTLDGRITLPAALLERLDLRAGDHVTLMEDGAGIHVEKADNGASESAAVEERPLTEVLDEWRERVRPRLKELGWENMTSDEIFLEIRGPDPGLEFDDEPADQ